MKHKIPLEVEIENNENHNKCSMNCPFFSIEHLDYFCTRYNKYIHEHNRVDDCLEEF